MLNLNNEWVKTKILCTFFYQLFLDINEAVSQSTSAPSVLPILHILHFGFSLMKWQHKANSRLHIVSSETLHMLHIHIIQSISLHVSQHLPWAAHSSLLLTFTIRFNIISQLHYNDTYCDWTKLSQKCHRGKSSHSSYLYLLPIFKEPSFIAQQCISRA